MKITLAKTAGFCFGVDRAVNTVYELLEKNEKVCTLGPIIHNPQLVSELENRGVRIVDNPSEVSADETLVIRSHGVPRAVIENAEKSGKNIVDATCPFVAKIHKIVSEASKLGHSILIAGDRKHSEVIGIIGNAQTDVFTFSNEEELETLLENNSILKENPVTVVSQTTFNEKIFKKSCFFIKKVCTNAFVFDTICNATAMRQLEADELSAVNDVMIVIGGKSSSNTNKLYCVCSANCDKTFLIETADELKAEWFKDAKSVGVVAGASTPARIIKEAIKKMSEILQPVDEQMEEIDTVQKSYEEMTDEEAFEASLNNLTSDQKVIGTVLAVTPTEIQVDFGRGLTGYVSADEYSYDSNVNLVEEVKVGDELNLIIMRINDQEGTAMLSKRRFDAIAGWDKIIAAKNSREILNGTVKDVIKGGVIATAFGVRVFIPASHAGISKNENLEDLKGKEVSFKIIEIGRGRRAVGSIRVVLRELKKAAESKIWETIAIGDRYTGTVKSITSYGAFVDIGGVDGMVHISELSWQKIKNPSEVVLVGDTVEVYVKDLDTEKKKISLGYKKEDENPWTIFNNTYAVDSVVKVTIVSMTAYGAFARIIPGVDGLIHISQIANKHVVKPQDELTIGQEVEAKIISIDNEKKRVSLSIRALLSEEVVEEPVEAVETEETAESTEAAVQTAE